MRKALTIAASDSGGACGIQADLKTFAALGVYGSSVVTSVTAQNTVTMESVHEIPADIVLRQASLVIEDIRPHAVKIGMIGLSENYTRLAELFRALDAVNIVVDPVVTCYRGCSWVLEDESIRRMRRDLLPLTRVFAPSIPDAEVILRRSITSVEEMEKAARAFGEDGPMIVVLKGGHLEGDPVDVLWDGTDLIRLSGTRISTVDDNGSGCVFSSAIAAHLALGREPLDAVRRAKAGMEQALRNAVKIGMGKGTPDHAFLNVAAGAGETALDKGEE